MFVVCHYSEIGLKGGNRRFFEDKLIENIKKVLRPDFFEFVKRMSGRIIIKLTKEGTNNKREVEESLKKVFGIEYCAFAQKTEAEIGTIKKNVLQILKNEKFKNFRITSHRSSKEFPLTSQEINEKVGAYIVDKLQKKVKLENSDLECFIEIVEKSAFLYLKKIKGLGGLPTSTGGKAIALISGGIDSPVAAFKAMKRGVRVIFLHFHAFPYTNQASIDKVKRIVEVLSEYQGKSKLYLIPFADIQREILLKTPAKLRVVLYRRMMLRIAKEVAKKEDALALVTGESLGQVASQTIENIKVINEAVKDLPILRPLIGDDKEEIIQKAKEIQTFNISILPYQDCCVRFIPEHPETKANLKEVKEAEKKLNIKKLTREAIEKTKIIKVINKICP